MAADLPLGQQPASTRIRWNSATSTLEVTVNNGVSWSAAGSAAVASPDAYAVLAAPATQLDLTINGNASGDFLIDGLFVSNNAPNQNVSILINGASTNMRARLKDPLAGSSYITTGWTFGNTAPYGFANASTMTFMGRLSARTGRIRKIWVVGLTADVNNDELTLTGEFTDTATNITQISLLAGNASGLAIGSYLRLTPLNTDK